MSTNLTEIGRKLDVEEYSVMHTGYRPELDVLPFYDEDQGNIIKTLLVF